MLQQQPEWQIRREFLVLPSTGYRLMQANKTMSSVPAIPLNPPDSSPLSHDEWWALFDQLRLSQQADYAEYGGPVAFVRRERDSDEDIR